MSEFRAYRAEVAEIDKRWQAIHSNLVKHLERMPEPVDVHHTISEREFFRVFIDRGLLYYQESAEDDPQPWGVIEADDVRDMTPKFAGIEIRPRVPGEDVGIVAQMIMCGILIEVPK